MKCPFCQSDDIKVADTRSFDKVIFRARYCKTCKQYFQTEELIQLQTPLIINPFLGVFTVQTSNNL